MLTPKVIAFSFLSPALLRRRDASLLLAPVPDRARFGSTVRCRCQALLGSPWLSSAGRFGRGLGAAPGGARRRAVSSCGRAGGGVLSLCSAASCSAGLSRRRGDSLLRRAMRLSSLPAPATRGGAPGALVVSRCGPALRWCSLLAWAHRRTGTAHAGGGGGCCSGSRMWPTDALPRGRRRSGGADQLAVAVTHALAGVSAFVVSGRASRSATLCPSCLCLDGCQHHRELGGIVVFGDGLSSGALLGGLQVLAFGLIAGAALLTVSRHGRAAVGAAGVAA